MVSSGENPVVSETHAISFAPHIKFWNDITGLINGLFESASYKSAPISALPLQKQLISATVDFRPAVNLQPAFIKIRQSLAESSLEKNMGLMTFKANGFGDVQGKHAVIHRLVQEQTYFDGHGGGHLA